MNQDDTAPTRDSLKAMFGQMKDFIKQHGNGRMPVQRRHKLKEEQTTQARKCCTGCGKLFDFALIKADVLPEQAPCPDCKSKFDDGWSLLVERQFGFNKVARRVFVKFPVGLCEEMRGQIVAVEGPTIDIALEKFNGKDANGN